MRLDPIENPGNIMSRIAYWISRRRFGKVITPLKVVYARSPGLMWVSQQIEKTMGGRLSLDTTLVTLIKAHLSMLNGCGFCEDIALAMAVQKRLGLDKFRHLDRFRESGAFTEREKAALSYVEEANSGEVRDSTFDNLRRHFDEREIVEITWVQAAEAYYNALSIPLEIGSDGLQSLAANSAAGGRSHDRT
ncbi:MAG: carboxymuconolactone decarboxylase family protein [Woeseia sp.]